MHLTPNSSTGSNLSIMRLRYALIGWVKGSRWGNSVTDARRHPSVGKASRVDELAELLQAASALHIFVDVDLEKRTTGALHAVPFFSLERMS